MTEEGRSDALLLTNNGDGQFVRYFAELDQTLGMLASWSRSYAGPALTAPVVTDYLHGLRACYRMLQSRFTFDANDSLMVDLSRSGYPHSYMLARIAADRAEALSEHVKGVAAGAAHFKQVFLNDLFETGTINRSLLNRIAMAHYAEVIAAMDGSFDPKFTCGAAQQDESEPKRYRLHWCAFDPAQNVPIACAMAFEYSGMDLTRALTGLKLVLKHESRAGVSVAALAHGIDTGVADIHPLTLSRATLGPVCLPGFPLTAPEQGFACPDGPTVEITIDHTRAVGTQKPSRLALTFGVSPAEHRVYAIRTDDPLCYERGADAVERVLILPHRAIQAMQADKKRANGKRYAFIPYIKEGELQ